MTNPIPAASGWHFDEYDSHRFWERVNFHGGSEHVSDPLAKANGECWLWAGDRTSDGYARFRFHGRVMVAHRLAFLDFGNALSVDDLIDHLCRNRGCVNPAHMEPVSHVVNVGRGLRGHITHCPNEHEYTDENTSWVVRRGRKIRYCRICLRTSRHKTYLRRKAEGKTASPR